MRSGIALTFLALLSISAPQSAASPGAGPCTHQPLPGGDPSIAGATALQIELCRARAIAGKAPPGLVVRATQAGRFDIEFGVWTFDLNRVRFEIVSAKATSGESVQSFRRRSGAILAINGGFFDFGPAKELRPVGLFIEKGRMTNRLGRALSGTLLIAGKRLEILETDKVDSLERYSFGLQSRPLLVEPGNKHGMRGNDHTRVPRSAICLTDPRHVLIFYAGGSGLSLFELATLLQAPAKAGGFACNVALNLDGGPSTQVSAHMDGAFLERIGQNVANGIIVLRR